MVHPVDEHVGARLRSLRKAAKLSQTELATSLGITFQQVQKYERGANRISASKLYDAAQLLHVPISSFFEGFEGQQDYPPASPPERALSRAELDKLVTLFEGVPIGPQRKRLLDLIEVVSRDPRRES